MNVDREPPLIGSGVAGLILGIRGSVVNGFARKGAIPYTLTPGRQMRYRIADILAFREKTKELADGRILARVGRRESFAYTTPEVRQC